MKNVLRQFEVSPVAGDVGIEIEVEGSNLPSLNARGSYWRREADGSLRGEESAEYVLRKPLTLEEARKALDYLDAAYTKNGAVVDDTVRAGVHVHVNCQTLTMTQLYNFMTIFYILEDVLVRFCGEFREGNLFCLRARDAESQVHTIRSAAKSKKFRELFHHDNNRYAAMNIKALGDYGSLEFRTMRGTRDLDLIYTWAEILVTLRNVAMEFTSPCEVIEQFSIQGPLEFLKAMTDTNFDAVFYKGCEKDLLDGMRMAQDIAYATDWTVWNRPARKIGQLEFDPSLTTIDEPEYDF